MHSHLHKQQAPNHDHSDGDRLLNNAFSFGVRSS